ncbi:MAG: PAS domain-containing protein [Bacteroidota bacterium]
MAKEINNGKSTTNLFNTLQLLKAYEQAIDENIISSITDTAGIIVHANKKFCEVSQYSSDEIIGKTHSIINSGFHSDEFFKTLWRTIGAGKVWHNEIRNKAKDGSFYWVDTVIVPIKNEEVEITHYLSLRGLITEKKELEEKNEKYLTSLEVLLVMTSNNVKKPLAECLAEMNSFDPEKGPGKDDLRGIMAKLQHSVSELHKFTGELSTFIREIDR